MSLPDVKTTAVPPPETKHEAPDPIREDWSMMDEPAFAAPGEQAANVPGTQAITPTTVTMLIPLPPSANTDTTTRLLPLTKANLKVAAANAPPRRTHRAPSASPSPSPTEIAPESNAETDATAYELFKRLHIKPTRAIPDPSHRALNHFVRKHLKLSDANVYDMYRFSKSNGLHTCDIVIQDEILGSFVHESKDSAMKEATGVALHRMRRHTAYCKFFLITVPPESPDGWTRSLLQFLTDHSVGWNGDELKGIYQEFTLPDKSMTVFTYKVWFQKVEDAAGGQTVHRTPLAYGAGILKLDARSAASYAAIRRLKAALRVLSPETVVRMVTEEDTIAIT